MLPLSLNSNKLNTPKQKIIAASVVLLLLGICLGTVIFFTEKPVLLFNKVNKQKGIAALAIRDNVIPFQKFGTRLFTYPYLDACYEKVIYLTEYANGGKETELISGLTSLLNEYEQVDIYLLAHANSYHQWFSELDSILRKKTRLVYNTGCSGAEQAGTWLSLGAKSYVAHKSPVSISPVFYFYFLRRWSAGYCLQQAIEDANTSMEEKLKRIALISSGSIKIPATILKESKGVCYGSGEYKITNE